MTHQDWMWGLKMEWLGASAAAVGGVAAAEVSGLHATPLTAFDEDGGSRGSIQPVELAVGLGYGRTVIPGLRLGASAHLLHLSVPERSVSGMAFGLGAEYETGRVTIGACARNVGPDIEGVEGTYALPREAGLGIALDLSGRNQLELSLLADRGGHPRGLAGIRIGGPGGTSLLGGVVLRTDPCAESATPSGGLEFPFGRAVISYSYVPEQDLGAGHSFTVTFAPL